MKAKKMSWFVLFVAVLFVANFVQAGIYYVDASVSGGSDDGSSWANAFADLQDALSVAVDGDDVWIAEGTYLPSTTDSSISFSPASGVSGNAAVKEVLSELEKSDVKVPTACELCFFVSETPDLGNPAYDLNEAEIISKYLMKMQNRDGSWGKILPDENVFKVPSSLRERRNVLPGMYWRKAKKTRDWSVAHVDYNSNDIHSGIQELYSLDVKVVSTAYALLALCEMD